jgi:hypothetical protein
MTKFMGDDMLHRLWTGLTSEQRVALLALRHGRPCDITLGDIQFVRANMPSTPSTWTVMAHDLNDVAEQIVANDREALR